MFSLDGQGFIENSIFNLSDVTLPLMSSCAVAEKLQKSSKSFSKKTNSNMKERFKEKGEGEELFATSSGNCKEPLVKRILVLARKQKPR